MVGDNDFDAFCAVLGGIGGFATGVAAAGHMLLVAPWAAHATTAVVGNSAGAGVIVGAGIGKFLRENFG